MHMQQDMQSEYHEGSGSVWSERNQFTDIYGYLGVGDAAEFRRISGLTYIKASLLTNNCSSSDSSCLPACKLQQLQVVKRTFSVDPTTRCDYQILQGL
ncbi:unnamed protein product [Allacma fusca]|uniref:Uncharacterized protein n=1 Tax=Allacma fusca TaxID=39272 RepID=A0A8J2KZ37_9HEXA|nr:unnamed protein product [Allacma fusca]